MHSINARPPAALSIVTLRIALLVTLAAGLHGLACTPASSGNNANNNANNNSPITGTVFFQVAASATSDEASGNFAITIELDCSGPITSDLTVEVFDTATGTASSGVDYVAFSTTVVTFLASSVDGATQTVNVNVMSDGDVEPDETVVLGLQNVTNGTIGATSTHTMTITNDDLAPAQVLYVADQDVAGEFELFLTTVASDGTIGTPVQLNGALVAGGDVRSQNISFGFSPDGKFVFYIADQNEDDVDELFLVDISGVPGAPVRVSADLTGTGKDVGRAFFSPDSTHLIYLADQDTDDTFELYKVSLASPAAGTRISRALSAGEQIPANGLRFSGNGLKATYMVTNGGGQFREVRVHTLADGTDVQANDALVGANINSNGGFFNAAGTKLIWWGEGEQAGVQELFIVDIVGVPSQARVHPSVVAAGGNIVFALLSPDGSAVTYVGDTDLDGKFVVWGADVSGSLPGTPRLLTPAAAIDQITTQSNSLVISKDSKWASFRADAEVDGKFELYVADISDLSAAVTPQKVHTAVADTSSTSGNAYFSPDSLQVMYSADMGANDNAFELYLATIASLPQSPASTRITQAMPATSDVWINTLVPLFNADGSLIFYRANFDDPAEVELYVVDQSSGTPAAPQQVNGTLQAGTSVDATFISPLFQRKFVIYLAEEAMAGRLDMMLARLVDPTDSATFTRQTINTGGSVQRMFVREP